MRIGVGRSFVTRVCRYLGALMVVLVVGVAVGCLGVGETPAPGEGVSTATQAVTGEPTSAVTPGPTPSSIPSQTSVAAAATPTVTVTPTPMATSTTTASRSGTEKTVEPTRAPDPDYDSTENMVRLFSGVGHDGDDSLEAIESATVNRDKSMVPVLIEMLRFFEDYVPLIESRKALIEITGREVMGNEGSWNSWMEWIADNADEYQPPDGYLEWKSTVMSLIDPRFGEFLEPAAEGSRVNVFEIAWGGVAPDGIPDLQNAPVVSAEEQDYLQPRDRVFGVSINGEHRAYPLRIVNAHEMANDVLGGEPIALAY